jgi:hypothetical protein
VTAELILQSHRNTRAYFYTRRCHANGSGDLSERNLCRYLHRSWDGKFAREV